MKISVLGCGRWGTFHAWYANKIGHEVTLWGRNKSCRMAELMKTRKNEYLTLPEDIILTSDLKAALSGTDIIIISISAQQLRTFAHTIHDLGLSITAPFILCMKGLEIGSGKRLTTIMTEELGREVQTAVWVGPGHVQDFMQGMPNCMIMASSNIPLTHHLVDIFSSSLIRFYYGKDLLGIEIGAAAKNVIGIAAGMLDGAGLSSLKGALMARGTHELSVLIKAMGGNKMTVYGLSHLGDYEATLFSLHSNNRRFGEDFIQGKPFIKLAEGVYTTEALMELAGQLHVELPITHTIYEIVKNKKNPQEQLKQLFLRSTKVE
ncbi:glycerol-3-phosphate dehydrogenase [Megasphaera cerevisiae DSM 20462]|jgi:glycerol-3-phosphate dehydrogenase (NAD(P)+)|uniref:Glycerol-3-phosphate dehydrogenase n=1 Tax=Megasphaera cerevisiae DSM 20462 TaxID=1122219 RepID=A0A0J6WZU9_9FIRM|nr:NAD(P)H-dependent glycerol-3-phosphate dehydrogenase [Megasphaera cerevisiae]KMO87798.1 glycerol-3-phosphate dehydrogenase [Megasphaera cerevisiae DSM 20462]OKY53597.1 glycerol-3-phosphate dehydrogenase [Megasphaera cerevisiae]SJZ62492.1 glycerol-3-phosphate dehydrogenase (NAD(P)+) [Megasphaera cerevisiae DSM 20462]